MRFDVAREDLDHQVERPEKGRFTAAWTAREGVWLKSQEASGKSTLCTGLGEKRAFGPREKNT